MYGKVNFAEVESDTMDLNESNILTVSLHRYIYDGTAYDVTLCMDYNTPNKTFRHFTVKRMCNCDKSPKNPEVEMEIFNRLMQASPITEATYARCKEELSRKIQDRLIIELANKLGVIAEDDARRRKRTRIHIEESEEDGGGILGIYSRS